MRWLLALLLTLSIACSDRVIPAPEDPGSYEIPADYMQTLLATQFEWVAAGLPFPDDCITMATRMTLYFDEWDETANHCKAHPASAPDDYDSGVEYNSHPEGYRVAACISESGGDYSVHFDTGLSEGRKHIYFAHEVIHGLMHCSQRGRDATHLDIYVWDTVLRRAEQQVMCGGRARFGETELAEFYCYNPWD